MSKRGQGGKKHKDKSSNWQKARMPQKKGRKRMSQETSVKPQQSAKWLSLLAVTLAFTFTFLTRFIWSPLMTTVSQEFGLSVMQAGLYMSAFFAGYLITQIPGGMMADKLQPKWVLVVCTVLSGCATAAMALIPGYRLGLVLRIVTGASSGCVMSTPCSASCRSIPSHTI